MTQLLRDIFISKKIERSIAVYAERLHMRVLMTLMLAGLFYLNMGNLFYSLVVSMVIENLVVDMYTARQWPPARWFFWEDEIPGLDKEDDTYKYRFILINGFTVVLWAGVALLA